MIFLIYTGLFLYISFNKKSILEKARHQLQEAFHTDVTLSDLDISAFRHFPYITILAKQLVVKDSLFQQTHQPVLQIGELRLMLFPLSALKQQITISNLSLQNGSLYLYTDSAGNSNSYPFKTQKKTAGTSFSLPFKKLSLENFSIALINEQKGKAFQFDVRNLSLRNRVRGDSILFNVNQYLIVRSFNFNTEKGSYLKDITLSGNYEVSFHTTTHQLRFYSIPLRVADADFQFTGNFDLSTQPSFSLRAATSSIKYNTAQQIVTPSVRKALQHVSLNQPLSVEAQLSGSLAGGDPLVNVYWQTKHTRLATPIVQFDSSSFNGRYCNEVVPGLPRKDPNSSVVLYNFTGKLGGLHLTSKTISLENLTIPTLQFQFRSAFQMSDLNEILQSDQIGWSAGSGVLKLDYKGPLDHIDSGFSGYVQFNKGVLQLNSLNTALTNCSGDITIDRNNIRINQLKGTTGYQGHFSVKGVLKNAIGSLAQHQNNMSMDLSMYTDYINTSGISRLLTPRVPDRTKKRHKKNLIASWVLIDHVIQNGKWNLTVHADKLKHEKIQASDIRADVSLVENHWTIKQLALSIAGGSVSFQGTVQERNNNHLLTASAKVNRVNAQQLFYAFNDFGLRDIGSRHIRGVFSMNAQLKLDLNRTGDINPSSSSGHIRFSLKEGALISYKPIEKLKTFIFKNRDFSHIRFADLENNILLNEGVFQIDRMQVVSSVLTMFVEGSYGLNGETDINIQLPLKNLRKRDSSDVLEKPAPSSGGGMSIFLRAKSQKDGTVSIRYAPFGRFKINRKNKK